MNKEFKFYMEVGQLLKNKYNELEILSTSKQFDIVDMWDMTDKYSNTMFYVVSNQPDKSVCAYLGYNQRAVPVDELDMSIDINIYVDFFYNCLMSMITNIPYDVDFFDYAESRGVEFTYTF